VADAPLGACQQGHRRRGERGQADPDPARPWLIAGDKRARRLDHDVEDQDQVAGGDKLLRAPLRRSGIRTSSREPPDDDQAGKSFDQTVDAERRQGQRARSDSRADRDRELDQVPPVPTPRK
jgi:hypothetical protein